MLYTVKGRERGSVEMEGEIHKVDGTGLGRDGREGCR